MGWNLDFTGFDVLYCIMDSYPSLYNEGCTVRYVKLERQGVPCSVDGAARAPGRVSGPWSTNQTLLQRNEKGMYMVVLFSCIINSMIPTQCNQALLHTQSGAYRHVSSYMSCLTPN